MFIIFIILLQLFCYFKYINPFTINQTNMKIFHILEVSHNLGIILLQQYVILIFYLNSGQPRTLLQLKLVGILTINWFLTQYTTSASFG
jgi:hypothetical protein